MWMFTLISMIEINHLSTVFIRNYFKRGNLDHHSNIHIYIKILTCFIVCLNCILWYFRHVCLSSYTYLENFQVCIVCKYNLAEKNLLNVHYDCEYQENFLIALFYNCCNLNEMVWIFYQWNFLKCKFFYYCEKVSGIWLFKRTFFGEN